MDCHIYNFVVDFIIKRPCIIIKKLTTKLYIQYILVSIKMTELIDFYDENTKTLNIPHDFNEELINIPLGKNIFFKLS
mgnify:CR=1 FL=1